MDNEPCFVPRSSSLVPGWDIGHEISDDDEEVESWLATEQWWV